MTTTALPDVFRTAANIIGERGWTRGTDMHPETGGVCANGALRLATGAGTYETAERGMRISWPSSPAEAEAHAVVMRAAHHVLNERLSKDAESQTPPNILGYPLVVHYNDRTAKDGSDVQRVFRETADWLEAHPLAALAAVQNQPVPYSLTQQGTAALDNKELVSA